MDRQIGTVSDLTGGGVMGCTSIKLHHGDRIWMRDIPGQAALNAVMDVAWQQQFESPFVFPLREAKEAGFEYLLFSRGDKGLPGVVVWGSGAPPVGRDVRLSDIGLGAHLQEGRRHTDNGAPVTVGKESATGVDERKRWETELAYRRITGEARRSLDRMVDYQFPPTTYRSQGVRRAIDPSDVWDRMYDQNPDRICTALSLLDDRPGEVCRMLSEMKSQAIMSLMDEVPLVDIAMSEVERSENGGEA